LRNLCGSWSVYREQILGYSKEPPVRSPSRRSRRTAAVAISLLLISSIPATIAGAATPPSVRLLVMDRSITVQSHRGKIWLDLGVYVAAAGGDFELRVFKADYDSPLQIQQVDSQTGAVLRTLPSELVEDWGGLKDFFGVVFKNQRGRVAARGSAAFCPNGWERQRVDDDGPLVSKYPTFCTSYFPFLRGMVWGLDAHWAIDAFGTDEYGRDQTPPVEIEPGTYQVRVKIKDQYRELLDIPARHATESLTVTVTEGPSLPAASKPDDEAEAAERYQGVPTVTDPDPSTVPDLVALPAWALRTRHRRGRDLLTFASTPWNAGPAPMVVEGFRRPEEDTMDAYQYFFDADGNPVGRAPAGTMEFHSGRGHMHWHFLQFVSYRLLDPVGEKVVRSKKQSFCLAPTDAVDLNVPRAEWSTEWGSACGGPDAIWIRETLPAGWGDTYFQSAAGQAFDITDVPNGWYQVSVKVNPLDRLYETTASNNEELRLIRLRGSPGARRVLVAPWNGIEA
jgi:hypothetical protein